jgi:3-oxoacyl-[acyl-carrier-protein] synthase-1
VKSSLAITGVGLVTPVGLSALVCMHSVRSSITRLEVQPYPDTTRAPVVGASVYSYIPFGRERRLAAMAAVALKEAFQQAAGANDFASLLPVVVVLGAPEKSRPGYRFPTPSSNLRGWLAAMGIAPVASVEVLEAGAASAQLALERAGQVLESGSAKTCIVGAVDNQVQLRVLRWHEEHYRLKCAYLTDGLMPAEAACFLVVEKESDASARRATTLARILATASDQETANILSDQPNAARGLTGAVRAALGDAGVPARELDAVWCDLNGESYRGREWAFTEIRVGVQTHTELIHPADCHGDLGAASAASLLGLAAMAQATGWANGKPQLVFCGSEEGIRTATVIGPPAKEPGLPKVTRAAPCVLPLQVAVPPLGPDEEDYQDKDDHLAAFFDWQLRQEHLDNLAGLYYQRRAILLDPTIPWPRLREPEQRILNHLDAVVASGPTSIWAVASGLLDGEEGKAFAGALLLGVLPTAANVARLDEGLKEPAAPVLAGFEAGLKHAPSSPALTLHIQRWLDHDHPAVRATAVSVLGYRRELEASRIVPAIQSDDPLMRLAAIHVARRRRYQGAAPALQRLLALDDPIVVHEALLSLLCLGTPSGPEQCRRLVLGGAAPEVRAPWLLALCGQMPDLSVLIRGEKALESPVTLSALGVLGNVRAVGYLLQALDSRDDKIKLAAAETLELFAASGLRETAVIVEQTELLPGEFIEARREVERVATSADVWRRWWNQNGKRFDAQRRWRRGQPFEFGSFIEEIKDPKTRFADRQRAYWELLILSGQSFPFEPDWFLPRQMEALARWESWWAGNKPR